MKINVQSGDVVVRAGLVMGKSILSMVINETYNHAGLALDARQVHHIEANGYETISLTDFFSPNNANGGAVFRFIGPEALIICAEVVQLARCGDYLRIPGNPFSTANDLRTVSCNEFVHELFRQAIGRLISKTEDIFLFFKLVEAYTDSAGDVKNLIKPREIQFAGPGGITYVAESLGRMEADHTDVKIKFEGKLELRCDAWEMGCVEIGILDSYTPNSFLQSQLFKLVDRIDSSAYASFNHYHTGWATRRSPLGHSLTGNFLVRRGPLGQDGKSSGKRGPLGRG
ncbi:MAG: hypothetical protein JW829_04485 [Pirellulales bacterium]|nr:hypothetical protein [Pirellulales bacterium]